MSAEWIAVPSGKVLGTVHVTDQRVGLHAPGNRGMNNELTKREGIEVISFRQMAEEPFRIFFPVAVIWGIIGVLLWPLYFMGLLPYYPIETHERLMAHGFFGGFLFGFLGTALPRLCDASSFRMREVAILFSGYILVMLLHLTGVVFPGDLLYLVVLLLAALFAGLNLMKGDDRVPPGFIMVPIAWICAVVATFLRIIENRYDLDFFWINLIPLLSYQAFVLLPLLGVGVFFLPKVFGVPSLHNIPSFTDASSLWYRKVGFAGGIALLIVCSFIIESAGWVRSGHILRLICPAVFLYRELPGPLSKMKSNRSVQLIKIGIGYCLIGYLAIILYPNYRTALLHMVFGAGLVTITLTVAMRVIYGHGGAGKRLMNRNRFQITMSVFILIAVLTRISGDFHQVLLITH